MDSRVVYKSSDDKVVEKLHFHEDGAITHQRLVDRTAVVEQNKSIHNQWSTLDRWGDGKIVLKEVDINIINEWKKKGWFTKEQFWRCLQDPRVQDSKVFGK